MQLLFSNRNFALLWWAGLLSTMGNWALQIALPVYVYETTQSTLATGLMFAVGTLPTLLFGSVAGIFVDRLDRRRTLVATNLLLFVGLLPLLFAPTHGLWLVYVVAFVQATLSQFVYPAENALLPTLVAKERLASANALNALNNNLGRLAGPALGGLLMGGLGLQAVIVFDAATFLLASFLTGLMVVAKANEKEKLPEPAAGPGAVWREWLAGLHIVKRERVVSVLFAYSAVTSVGEGVMAALFIPFVADVLRGDALEVGWLMSAQAVGGVVGGVVVSAVAARFAPARLLGWGSVGLGLVDAFIFNYPAFLSGVTLGLVLFALAGLPVAALQAGMMTLFQTNVEDKFLGRVFGAYGTTAALFNLLGIAAGGLLGDELGVVPVINTQAVVYLVGGLLVLRVLRRSAEKGESGV